MEYLLTKCIKCNTMYYRKGAENMTYSFRCNDDDAMLIRKYAELQGLPVSDVIRKAVLERIEDEYDLKLYAKGMALHNENPVTVSLDELEKELGFR